MKTINVATWNILSDALGKGEFICENGDSKELSTEKWENRYHDIVAIMKDALSKCDYLCVQENDHAFSILRELNYTLPVGMIYSIDTTVKNPSRKYGQTTENTYEEEDRESAVQYSALYDKEFHDNYNSCDGLTIYYRKDKVTLLEVDGNERGRNVVKFERDIHVVTNESYCVFGKFLDGDTTLTIGCAHYTSGEGYKKEEWRCMDLQKSLSGDWPNLIIGMDSNCSVYYIESYYDYNSKARTILDVMRENEFYDGLFGTKGLECLKMRHGMGRDKSKHYSFTFDRMHRILVKENMKTVVMEDDFGFKRYDKSLFYEFEDYRLKKEARKALTEYCSTIETKDSMIMFADAYESLKQIYPRDDSPSDHPIVGLTVTF